MSNTGPVWPPAGLAEIRETQAAYTDVYRSGSTADGNTSATTVKERAIAGGLIRTKETTTTGNGTSSKARLVSPLPATISRAKARLLYGETLTVAGEDTARDRLTVILDAAAWDARLSESEEIASAAGDVYLRAAWDAGHRLMPIPQIVRPSRVTPVFAYDTLVKATIETTATDKSDVWRHLEVHTPGRITHELWKGSATHLGIMHPLESHPMTEGLAPVVDAESGIDTGTQRLTVVHVPNTLPNPDWANHPTGRHLGRSDYHGLTGEDGLFAAYHEANGSLRRDVRHGHSRINASEELLTVIGENGKPTLRADLDREVYVALGATANADDKPLFEQTQGDIRVDEHKATVRHWLDQILQAVGLGHAVLGLAGEGGAVTATEVISRDAVTRQTYEDATRIRGRALTAFYNVLLDVDAHVFNGPGAGKDGIKVSFPPAVVPTREEVAREVQMLVAAEAISIESRVRKLNPDADDTWVAAEVGRIREDSGRSVMDLGDIPS